MQVVYGVPWIEVEYGWGDRPEGWHLFLHKEQCINASKEASKEGGSAGGYIGPIRPLTYTEIPLDSLEPELRTKIANNGECFTSNYWEPKFKGLCTPIL